MSQSNKNYNFGFKIPQSKGLFTVTDPGNIKPYEIKNIQVSKLEPFKNHPFRLYEGKRMEDMCRSVKETGILLPIIVRPINEELYEILSGHNRVEAAKATGLEFVPGIIREGLSDDEALLIVTETNLIQRSFADLLHSERAVALKCHVKAISKQGKRNDLISEINEILSGSTMEKSETAEHINPKTKSREETAEKYGLAPRNVSRYMRLCELDKSLLNKVDMGEIPFIPAVSISYLPMDEQRVLNSILDENKYKVDMKKAETLREFSRQKKLTHDNIVQILSNKPNRGTEISPPASFRIKYEIYSKYFDNTITHDEAESIIDKALDEYFSKYSKE